MPGDFQSVGFYCPGWDDTMAVETRDTGRRVINLIDA